MGGGGGAVGGVLCAPMISEAHFKKEQEGCRIKPFKSSISELHKRGRE